MIVEFKFSINKSIITKGMQKNKKVVYVYIYSLDFIVFYHTCIIVEFKVFIKKLIIINEGTYSLLFC